MSDIIPNFLQLCIICTRFYDIYQLSSLHHFIWLVFLVWHCSNMSFICRFLQAKVKFYKCSQNFMFLPKLIFFYTRPPCQILDHKMFSFLSDADTGTSISRQVCSEIVSHKGCFFYLGCHYVCMGEGQCPLTLNQTYILTMEFKLSMFVQQRIISL